jgi:phosphoribosylglycinamide formyltransferase-1
MNIAVLVSGSGTNLQAIIDAVEAGRIPAKIALVVSDKAGAPALGRARKAGIETLALDSRKFASREEFDREISKNLGSRGVGLVALAGYMRLLGPAFIREYRNRIMNVHPALLPSFKGTHGIKDALAYGVKVTGATVHFVEDELDAGPVIMQSAVEVRDSDTEATLLERVHKEEHRIYPEAIRLFVEGKLEVDGRRVRIAGRAKREA